MTNLKQESNVAQLVISSITRSINMLELRERRDDRSNQDQKTT